MMNDDYEDRTLKRMQEARKRLSEASDQDRREALRMEHLRAVAKQAGEHSRGQRIGCLPVWGIFFALCLALAMMGGCAPNRQFKQQSASVLDVARQLHWEGCEAEALLQEDLCENAYAVLVGSEPGMEDEIAKRRALNELWIAIKPQVMKYAQDGALTAAQLLLAYLTGNMLGNALSSLGPEPITATVPR